MKEVFHEKVSAIKEWLNNCGKLFLSSIIVTASLFIIYLIYSFSFGGELKVIFFDIGQGDSIFIETPSHKQILIDGGPNNVVLERLSHVMSFYDRDIDLIIETHADADHITGLIPVLEKYNVGNIVASPIKGETNIFNDLDLHLEEEKNNGANVYVGKVGDEIDFQDGTIIKILYPSKNISAKTDTNEASVSVLLNYGDKNFLFTGDLPTKKENYLLSSGLLPNDITVYKAGHHGSKTSSGEQLLSYIKPYYSVISAGRDNKYGHPNMETIERLKKYSKVIFSTIDFGSIEFVTDGNEIQVSSF